MLTMAASRVSTILLIVFISAQSNTSSAFLLSPNADRIQCIHHRHLRECLTVRHAAADDSSKEESENSTVVTKVLNMPAIEISDVCINDGSEIPEYTYEKAIYTESINALHKSGLYEEADQLYAAGVTHGHLPWAVMQISDSKQLRLDLHGMSAAVAHSAVRVSLQKEVMGSSQSSPAAAGNIWARDVMIITGMGRRSGERFRPVLRPEVQRMLTEEFYPPLGTSSIPGNMGALLVPSGDIGAWLSHQQKQKGERLLFVADMLRDISSGNRIEKAIERVPSRLERALLMKFKPEDSSLEENDAAEQ